MPSDYGFNAIRFSDFLLSLKTSWIHRYTVTKVCDHWCDKLDEMLGVNSITRGDLLHWGSAKWQHVLEKITLSCPTFSRHTKFSTKILCRGSRIKKIDGSNSLSSTIPNILNGRRMELRPNDYNIPDTR